MAQGYTWLLELRRRAVCQAAAPLRGIVHAAGVLDDGVVERQTAERLARVLAPKVRGAWHLHVQTAGLPLDFFVCFSSMASLLGSPGQSSYAAANAFLDGLAHHRRAAGLPGLSINWGPWADAGMAAGLRSRLESQGEGMIDPALGTRIFSALLGRTMPQVGVMRIDWARFRDMHPQAAVGSMLLGLGQPAARARTSRSSAPETSVIASLRAAPIERRKSMVEDLVQSHVAQVLGHRAGTVPRTQGFLDMGLDSLTATELGRRLQRDLDRSLPTTLTFDYPTVESLVTYLVEKAITADVPDQPLWRSGVPAPDDPLDLLSRDEIAALLALELEALGEGRSS